MNKRKEMPILDSPLNATERALYNVAVRLDRIIELIEDIIDVKEPEIKEVLPSIEIPIKKLKKANK